MRNPAFAALIFCQAFLDVVQQEQFIQNFVRRSLFRHLLDGFQNKLTVAHNSKTMRRQIRKRKSFQMQLKSKFPAYSLFVLSMPRSKPECKSNHVIPPPAP